MNRSEIIRHCSDQAASGMGEEEGAGLVPSEDGTTDYEVEYLHQFMGVPIESWAVLPGDIVALPVPESLIDPYDFGLLPSELQVGRPGVYRFENLLAVVGLSGLSGRDTLVHFLFICG